MNQNIYFYKSCLGETYRRVERTYGAIHRSISLPANIKMDEVIAGKMIQLSNYMLFKFKFLFV